MDRIATRYRAACCTPHSTWRWLVPKLYGRLSRLSSSVPSLCLVSLRRSGSIRGFPATGCLHVPLPVSASANIKATRWDGPCTAALRRRGAAPVLALCSRSGSSFQGVLTSTRVKTKWVGRCADWLGVPATDPAPCRRRDRVGLESPNPRSMLMPWLVSTAMHQVMAERVGYLSVALFYCSKEDALVVNHGISFARALGVLSLGLHELFQDGEIVAPRLLRSMTIPSHINHTMRPRPNTSPSTSTAPSTSRTGITVRMPDTPATMPR
jgi:hypothetical protein